MNPSQAGDNYKSPHGHIKVTNHNIQVAYLIYLLVALGAHKSLHSLDEIQDKIYWLQQTPRGQMRMLFGPGAL